MSAGSIVMRALAPADRAALASFLCANDVPEVTRRFNPFPMSAASAERIVAGARRDMYFGAFEGGRVVGLSMLRGWDEGYEVPSFGIVIDHRRHGAGIGSRLTDFTLAEAARAGCARVRLSVYGTNAVAYRMYRARGFHEIEREPVEVGGSDDERIVMVKELVRGPGDAAPPAAGGDAR